jgi:hypothetical protein
MAEPSTFPEEHVTAPLVYQRISGFAIAGLIVAVAYALSVAVAGYMGVRSQTPILLPMGLQPLPLLAVVLSLVAMFLIRRSEGTLAGLQLAKIGFWLSVVFGLGYWAYYAATYIAVCQQADTFTQRWFDKLKQGKVIPAFVDTQEPARRQKVNAEDEAEVLLRFNTVGPREMAAGRGPMDRFRDSELVRRVVQAGAETQIQPLGVKEWDYAKSGGYKVQRAYHITTPEGRFDAHITVVGSESRNREFEGRQWFVVSGGPETTGIYHGELSDLGKALLELRSQTRDFIGQWSTKLTLGQLKDAYLDVQGATAEGLVEAEAKARQKVVARLAVSLFFTEPGPLANLAFYDILELPSEIQLLTARECYSQLFRQSGILQTDKLVADDPIARGVALKGARRLFAMTGQGAQLGRLIVEPQSRRPWKVENDRLRLPHDCKAGFEIPGRPPTFGADVTITVESDPGPVAPARKRQWRVVGVEFTHAEDRSKAAAGPMASMMGGPPGSAPPPEANLPPPPPEYVQPENTP